MVHSAAQSSAPLALRGSSLRAALRRLRGSGDDGPPSPIPYSEPAPAPPAPVPPALLDLPAIPESAGPRALRPSELARWLERNR
jgi:hypothetical protein